MQIYPLRLWKTPSCGTGCLEVRQRGQRELPAAVAPCQPLLSPCGPSLELSCVGCTLVHSFQKSFQNPSHPPLLPGKDREC